MATYYREGRRWVIDVVGYDCERGDFSVGTTQARLFRGEIRQMAVNLIEVMCGESEPNLMVVRKSG
jgi:hypothetical protein